MKNDIIRGELVRWNEDRGFGFISSNNRSKDIFIHISSLKRMNRRPIVGDIIYFKEQVETNGKIKAINASIEGADLKKRKINKNNRNESNNKNITNIVYLVLFIVIGYFAYDKFTSIANQSINKSTLTMVAPTSEIKENYSCQGKTYCSEMTSCAEAKYYQNNCSGTKMDGDGDGVPCESQWCNTW